MHDTTHSHAHNLGVFGWNFSFIGELKITTDGNGNAYLLNSNIQSVLPAQLPGTALYDTPVSESPLQELFSSPYSLNFGQLLQPYSSGKRMFSKQADGSYTGSSDTLTWNVDHYQLEEENGNLIVFRSDGQLDYIEDSNGYRVTAGYTNDVLTEISASNGDSFTLAYNSDGRIATITDEAGVTNTYNYDVTGQYLLSVEDVNGTTSFKYDNPYDPTVVTGITYGDGTKVNYDYDAVGRLQQVIYGEGREALAYTYSYDNNSSVTITNPNGGTIQQLRNEEGRVGQTIDALGRTVDYSYDEDGNLVGIDGELGYSVSFTYDEAGNVISQTDALGHTTEFTYVANSNNLSGFRDARGNDVLYSYDTQGNLTNIIYEDGTQEQYIYDANGLLTKSINRRGQEIAYEYNNSYQVTKETHSDGSIIEYGYSSNNGLLNSIGRDSGSEITRFEFDQAKNEISIIYPSSFMHDYQFDDLGRRTALIIKKDLNIVSHTNYSYDNFGRLDRLTDGNGNLIVDYDYHPVSGQLVKETNGNGTTTSYSYDLAGQLISLVNSQADGTVNSGVEPRYV